MATSVTGWGRGLAGLALVSAASLVLVAVGIVASGCDPGHGVTFENQTNEPLSVYRFGDYEFTLEPFQETTATILEFAGSMTIEAKDDSDNVVYSQAFTWEQLEQMNWQIVITDTSGLPRPSPTASALPP